MSHLLNVLLLSTKDNYTYFGLRLPLVESGLRLRKLCQSIAHVKSALINHLLQKLVVAHGRMKTWSLIIHVLYTRETGEGWPLLTVETEANGDSKSTNEGGLSLVSSADLSCQYKRFVSCLGCSSRHSIKYFVTTRKSNPRSYFYSY
jgi:hypothetical protein